VLPFNRKFSGESLWTQHMKFNHLCTICNLTFSHKFLLTIHRERVHEIFDENSKFNEEMNQYKKQVEKQFKINENYDEGLSRMVCKVS